VPTRYFPDARFKTHSTASDSIFRFPPGSTDFAIALHEYLPSCFGNRTDLE
jgi:hypothetical protein